MMTKFDRNNPAICTLKERYLLTKEGSTKQTWHITLNLQETELAFHPGDSVGIYAQNDPTLVSHLIQTIGADPLTPIYHKRKEQTVSLEFFLTHHANLNQLTSKFLKLVYEHQPCVQIDSLLEDRQALRVYLSKQDPLGFLQEYRNTDIPLQTLIDQFGPLLPRFYSVASCQKTTRDTLDLTVALFNWMQDGKKRYGVASHFLCHLAQVEKTPISLFVQPASHFRMPQNPKTPMIMIGSGTGVAPFRAFMQKRKFHGMSGKNWLFFGERNRASDYFYQDEWAGYVGLKVETAFSRDQSEKIYVQHKLQEHGQEVYTWLKEGAYLYVCGDAKQMAKDVETALLRILIEHGCFDEKGAKDYLKSLKKQGRYLLDVY